MLMYALLLIIEIFCDCQRVMQEINHCNDNDPLVLEIMNWLVRLFMSGIIL